MRIKASYETSENVVKTQLSNLDSNLGLRAYSFGEKGLNLDITLYTFLPILSISVFEQTYILKLVTNPIGTIREYAFNQLNLHKDLRREQQGIFSFFRIVFWSPQATEI